MAAPEPGPAEGPPAEAASDPEPPSAIRVDVADAIATITLDRPEALNALTSPM